MLLAINAHRLAQLCALVKAVVVPRVGGQPVQGNQYATLHQPEHQQVCLWGGFQDRLGRRPGAFRVCASPDMCSHSDIRRSRSE